MLEQGVVRGIRGELVEIEVLPASPEACTSCRSCEEGPTGKLLIVERLPGIELGNRVVLEIRDPGGLGPPVMAFLLPVLAVLIGAILGARVPDWVRRPEYSSTVFSLLGAVLLLVPVGALIWRYDASLKRRGYGPRIVRVES